MVDKVKAAWDFIRSHVDSAEVLALLDKYVGEVTGTEQDSEVAKLIAELMERLDESVNDASKLQDIMAALAIVTAGIMEAAERCKGMTGPEKKAFVQALLWALYRFVDGGRDGSRNRINIPWVPQVIEVRIERQAVYLASGYAIEAIVHVWNKRR
jgi:hypothetical protein